MIIPRETGEIPISVSTALAIESLFNQEIERDFSYNNQSLWFNVRTIFRNLLGAVKVETDYDDEMILLDLLEEITVILTVLEENNVKGKNKVVLYANSHNNLEKLFPYAKVKRPKTDKQVEYYQIEKRIIETLFDNISTNDDYSVETGDCKLEGKDQSAIVLTHHPVDLLSRYKFSELLLLESHTGVIKKQSQWNTKLTGGKQNPRLPFNSLTLQVFGDQSTNFYSYSAAYKKVLIDLAKKANWNALTGSEKIISDLTHVKVSNPVIYDLFAKIVTKKMFF